MKYKLSDSVTIIEENDKFIFLTETKKILIAKDENIEIVIRKLLKENTTINCDTSNERKIKSLINNKILMPEYNYKDSRNLCNLRYLEYFCDDPLELLNKLQKQNILIVGVGGVGQCIIQHLVNSGFRRFILIDYDIVKEKNMNRQFLCDVSKINQLKTEAVSEYLKQNISGLYVNTINLKIEAKENLEEIIQSTKPDFVVCAADTPPDKIKTIIAESSRKFKLPCGFASVGLHIGEVGPILTEDSNFEAYIKYIRKRNNYNIIYNPILQGSSCFTNTLISVMLAQDIMFYFTNISTPNSLNQSIFYNLLDMKKLKVFTY